MAATPSGSVAQLVPAAFPCVRLDVSEQVPVDPHAPVDDAAVLPV